MPHLQDDTKPTGGKLRFGVFEADPRSRELLKYGVRIPLQRRPFEALLFLLQHANDVVTREELQKHLWSSDVFVDFDHGLNTAIRKVRRALNDDAGEPRYIETVGRLGYRFLLPVEIQQTEQEANSASRQSRVESDLPNNVTAHVAVPDPPDVPGTSSRSGERIKTRVRLMLAGVVLAAIPTTAYILRPEMPAPHIGRVVQLTKSGGTGGPWYLEPIYTDGPRVYYQSVGAKPEDRQIRQVLLNGNEDTPTGILGSRFRIRGLSPDNTEFIATSFVDGRWTVWKVPVSSSGSPRRIGDLAAGDIAWSHDGNWFAYAQDNQLFLVRSDGTSPHLLATVSDASAGIDHIRWSPDDRRLRFTLITATTQALWEVRADGRGPHELRFPWPGSAQECCGDWMPDGRYFVFRSRRDGISNLWALEEKSDWWHRANRDPIQLTFGPTNYYQPICSRNGNSIFAIGTQPSGELVRYDAARKDFVPFLGGRSIDRLIFSRDRKWVAYVDYPEGTLWRARSDGTEPLQLTFPPLQVGNPRWSPNGNWIAFHDKQRGHLPKGCVISAEGGNPEPFPSEPWSQSSPDWMPDGDSLIYSRDYGAENPGLYRFDLKSGRSEQIPRTDGLYGPSWSPDGRHLSAVDAETDALLLVDLKSGKRTRIAGAVTWPTWSADSQYLYFFKKHSDANWIFRVHVSGGTEGRVVKIPFLMTTGAFTLAPDGSPIMSREHGGYEVYSLSLK